MLMKCAYPKIPTIVHENPNNAHGEGGEAGPETSSHNVCYVKLFRFDFHLTLL